MSITNIDVALLIRILPSDLKLPNLGGRSSFTIRNDGASIEIVNSGGHALQLTDAILRTVHMRYIELGAAMQLNAGQYVGPNWPGCPNRIFSPLIAKLVDYILSK